MHFQVGDIVQQTVSKIRGVIFELQPKHPAYVKILWFGGDEPQEYPYTFFEYFTKVS